MINWPPLSVLISWTEDKSVLCLIRISNIHLWFIQAQQEVAQVHSEARSTHESKLLDTDTRVRRKEKKKKMKKVKIAVIVFIQTH